MKTKTCGGAAGNTKIPNDAVDLRRLNGKSRSCRASNPKSCMASISSSSPLALFCQAQIMLPSICQSCRSTLRLRYRQQISILRNTRRNKSAGPNSQPLESWYWDTLPPNPRQLAAAKWFFDTHRPQKIFTANEWQSQRHSGDSETLIPEVAFLGRSNVGKSSLLNALLNDNDLNKVGAKPGKTKVLHAYGLYPPSVGGHKRSSHAIPGRSHQPNHLVTVLDAPGYGHGSQNDWGEEIIKYLKYRKHIRRIFILINAQHGLQKTDLQVLKLLRQHSVSYQVVATKCDRLEPPSKRQEKLGTVFEEIQKVVQPDNAGAFVGLGEILAVGWLGDGTLNKNVKRNDMQGVSSVQWSVLRAAGLEEHVLRQFTELDQAVKYDNSPIRPNAVRKIPELQTPPQEFLPPPPEPFPENIPVPPKADGGVGVSRGMDALIAAMKKPKNQSTPQHRPSPPGEGKSPNARRMARRRAARRAIKLDEVSPTQYHEKAMRKAAQTITPRPAVFDAGDDLSIEELLAASMDEGMRADGERQKGQRSRHKNPFSKS